MKNSPRAFGLVSIGALFGLCLALASGVFAARDDQTIDLPLADLQAFAEILSQVKATYVEEVEDEVLIDSSAIIDYLIEIAPADKKLVPVSGPERWAILRQNAVALGVAEKAVALSYERNRRPEDKVWDGWVERLSGQLAGGLDALEQSLQGQDWLIGDEMTLADVTAVCAFDSARMIAPELVTDDRYPRLASLSERCTELPAFADTRP